MPQTKPVISVENVVATGDMAQKMDLNDMQERFAGTEYHPEQFPGLVFRLAIPKTATLIFRTGKMVCTGSKSKDQAERAINEAVRKLRKNGVRVDNDPVIAVQNIVASINLGERIHIEQAARTLPRSMYEPEQFPGLIHRVLDPKAVMLLFASGKMVCTGGKSEDDVFRSVNGIHALLEEKGLMAYES